MDRRKAGDGAHQRSLAGAIGAEQGDNLARRDAKRYAAQNANAAITGVESRNSSMLVLLAEIGVDDLSIGADFRRRAFGDDIALMHHGDALGQLHHHPHIMLDHEERDGALARQRANGCDRGVGLGLAHARNRLVEQKHFRPHGERTGKIDALLDAERQVAHRRRRERRKLESVEQRRRLAAAPRLRPDGAAEADMAAATP